MADGDAADFAARLKAVLPNRWFADTSPVLSSLSIGIGSVWAGVYQLYAWVVLQTRIATASGAMLDLASWDFFGAGLTRRPGEADASLRTRVGEELFRERATRHAVAQVLTDLVGNAPVIFEPARPADTGVYGQAGTTACANLAYGAAGGYGSLLLPIQFFLTAYRGSRSVIANVMGYGSLSVAGSWAGGGYGQAAIEYASLAWTGGQITDADLFAAVADVLPVNTIAWMALVYTSPVTQAPGAPVLSSAGPAPDGTTTDIALAWSAPATGGAVAAYMLFYRVSGSGAFSILADGIVGTSYTATGLTAGSAYDFAVCARNSAGPGPLSAVLTASPASTALAWITNLPPSSLVHGGSPFPLNVQATPNPTESVIVNFAFSASNTVLPTSGFQAASYWSGGAPYYWNDYVNPPATAGTWYLWAIVSDHSAALVSSAITVT